MKKRETLTEGLQREAEIEAAREVERRRRDAEQKLRASVSTMRTQVAHLEQDLAEANELRECLAYVASNPLRPITIKPHEKASRVHEATAVLVLSDLHLEETVDPREVSGLNEYNPTIAAERMHRLAVGVKWQIELARSKYKIRELLVMSLGDWTSNYLREEDLHGNAYTPMDAFVFAAGLKVRLFRELLELPDLLIRCPMVPGNHDRMSMTKRTPTRKRVRQSSAPLLAHMIAREFQGEPRVQIELSESEHVYVDVYGKLVRGMHGDRFKYAGGVGGIFVPARRHVVGLNKARHAAITVFGHWHQSRWDDLWVSNGSLIGPNPYSIAFGMDPEPPSQTLFMIDKNRGRRLYNPIQVSDRMEWT